jgi:hypothetical protein
MAAHGGTVTPPDRNTIGHYENLAAFLRQYDQYDPSLTIYAAELLAKGIRESLTAKATLKKS